MKEQNGFSAGMHPDGKLVVISQAEGPVSIWTRLDSADSDSAAAELEEIEDVSGDWLCQPRFSSSGRYLIIGSNNVDEPRLRLWDLSRKGWAKSFLSSMLIEAVELSPDDRFLVASCRHSQREQGSEKQTPKVVVWDVETERVVHTFDSAEQFAPNKIQFRNSTQFVTAGRLLELWSLEEGKLVGRGNRLQLIDDSVVSIEITPDGKRAFLGCGNGECEVWIS